MALSTCGALGYTYTSDFCMPVIVTVEQDEFTVDGAWIGGATLLGLILGAGIVLLLTKPFLGAWEKRKRQKEEALLESAGKANIVEARAVNGWHLDKDGDKKKPPKEKEKKTFLKASRFWRKKKSLANVKDKDMEEVKEEDVDPALARGMVDVMLQTNSTGSEVEMADQDMATIVAIERSNEEEKSTLMMKTLGMLLKKKMENRSITQNFFMNFMRKTEEDEKDLTKMIEREKEEAEEALRNDPKVNKDSQTMETEMQKLQTHYNNKQSKLRRDHKDKIRLDLLRSSGMPEAEVDEMIEKLMNNMAMVEEKLGLEQARQRRALEQRLARRRQAIEYKEVEAKEAERDLNARVDAFDNLLTTCLKDSSKLERQTDDIVTEYANDLDVIRKYYAREHDGLVGEKCELLQKFRLNSFYKLLKKQEKEKAAVLHSAAKTTNSAEFIKLYHDMVTKHHMEQEALSGELDQKEVQELHKIKQDLAREENKAMDRETEKQTEKLENLTNMTSTEAEKLIKLHKAQMANYNSQKQKEKQAMMARLQERLQQRLAAADEAEARDQKEQETLKEEQMSTMEKVLTTNMDLTQEAKDRVLKEHEQNMQALSNQLLRSKLRQQKSLEIKLNQRKARLADLKQKQEELQMSRKLKRGGEKGDVEAKLAADIEKEEESFEAARQAAVAELRRQLSKETDEALKVQDEEIGLLIGRLQVGQARRKAILEKQDATLKHLQEALEKKVASGDPMPSSVTDQIIQQHYNHVSHLNEQLQRRREKQEQAIMEKLNNKKMYKEQEIETQLEEEAQSEYTEQQKRGAGYASLALMQAFLEQRHTKAMQDLETEMFAELEKCKADLNTELELELKSALEAQKQDFLTQLASVSKMSRGDLQDAVAATKKGQYDNKAAKRLAKDLRDGMDRAKTSLDNSNSGRTDDLGYRRANTDLNQSTGFEFDRTSRKGSAVRPVRGSAKQAFVESDEDDNGF